MVYFTFTYFELFHSAWSVFDKLKSVTKSSIFCFVLFYFVENPFRCKYGIFFEDSEQKN